MNKGIIFLLVGLAAGGAAGFYAGKRYEEKKADEQIKNAVEHHRRRYEAKLNEALKDQLVETINDKKEEKADAKIMERKAKIPNVEPELEDMNQKTNYNKMSKSEMLDKTEEYHHDGPYEVQPGTYDDFLGIDRYDLTFFAEDEVVMESNEEIWDDAATRVGELIFNPENYGRFEPDIIYIINEEYGQGYKVTLDMGSYSDYMAGVEGL